MLEKYKKVKYSEKMSIFIQLINQINFIKIANLKKSKMVLTIVGVAAFAGTIAFNVSLDLRSDPFSILILANVEALALSESDGSYSCCSPYTETCSTEGSLTLPGVKKTLGGCQ